MEFSDVDFQNATNYPHINLYNFNNVLNLYLHLLLLNAGNDDLILSKTCFIHTYPYSLITKKVTQTLATEKDVYTIQAGNLNVLKSTVENKVPIFMKYVTSAGAIEAKK